MQPYTQRPKFAALLWTVIFATSFLLNSWTPAASASSPVLSQNEAAYNIGEMVAMTAVASRTRPLALPGFKNYLMLGVASDNSPASENWVRSTATWDLRYQYLVGNVNTSENWTNWNSPSGQFATMWLNDSGNLGTLPVLTYYCILDSPQAGADPGDEATKDINHLNNAATMRNYYANFKLMLDKIKAFGKTTIVHIEPDLWGFLEQRALNNSQSDDANSVTAAVNSAGYGDVVAGLPDNPAGFANALIRLRDKYAPNALLAYHDSTWGALDNLGLNTDPGYDVVPIAKHGAKFYKSLNANFDLIFNDISDGDAGWYGQWDKGGHWWDENNLKFPNYAQYATYLNVLHRYTQKPLVLWQLPIGNTLMLAANNTRNHYQDNRVQYFLGANYRQNLAAYVNAGVVALLFGSGQGDTTDFLDGAKDGVTNPAAINNNDQMAAVADDDGGYLRQRGAAYYASPVYLPGFGNGCGSKGSDLTAASVCPFITNTP